MDRNREVRRAMTNGLTRRRHRSNSLRDSPEEDGTVELQETIRLRDRGSGKKDRDRDRERSSRNKRRRGDRLMHGSHRDDGGDDSTEESVNDDEEDEDDDAGGGVGVRMLPPNPASSSSAMSNHHQLTHRKTFPQAKVFRAVTPWKPADEMIGVSVPRKARSASTKRSHECWISGGGVVGEQINRQASTSPVRPGHVPGPISPSSSNISVRKKIKPNGPKHRPPPKTSSKSSSSNQDEIEIEIAEVLYGMMRQPQGPSKQEIMGNESSKFDPNLRDDPNSRDAIKSTSDAKSRVSSPISNSQPAATQSSSMLPQNSNSPPTPLTAVVPKRKKPRPMNYSDENQVSFAARSSPIASTAKPEIDQPEKMEISSSNLEKNTGSVVENGGCSYDLANTQVVPPSSEGRTEPVKPESKSLSDSKPLTEDPVNRDVVAPKEEEANLPKKESEMLNLDDAHEDTMTTKSNQTITGIENHREEKFLIDLMAPPPQLRSSPKRDGEIIFMSTEPKSMGSDVKIDAKPIIKEAEKLMKMGSVEPEEKKATAVVEVAESHKVNHLVNKERFVDLQMDIKKNEKDIGTSTVGGNKLHQHVPKQQQPQPNSRRDEPNNEKTAQSTGLPLPMSVANWPGGLPPMGYMGPLQGVVSMDANPVSSAAIQPPHLLFSQPRPKRCATHCYIARNICYHQQFTRMGSFWPAPAGSAASLYGPKPSNLNVAPSTELHGNIPVRGVSSVQDKGQGLAIFPSHTSKERVSQAANIVDAAQRKQILLQQAIPPGAPSNILHGPAFIFPLSQQHAAASARPGSVKSPPVTGTTTSSSSTPNSAPVSASATPAGPVTAMSFNYPNLSASETQYLAAILQSNAYPFPIPAHVGAPPPPYRGTHPQAMPFFNGSFYSSQMLHPSQLQQHQQQQQQQQHQQPLQTQQIQQGHQNTSISSGSSSSQKHLQNNQQRPLGSGINGGSGSLQNFPAPKNRPTQSLLQPHQQQNQHIPLPHQARQLESEVGGEDSPSTADSRVSRPNMTFYGQNFAMPMHPQNFALMSPPVSLGGVSGTASSGAGANHSEKKQQQPQQQGFKGGVETLPPQAFPMSFASINGATTPGLDISSMAQNHAILQSFTDATTRHGYNQIMAAAVAAQAQQKKNYRISEEGKTGGGDTTNVDEERKAVTVKGSVSVGQSIAFSRPDSTDAPVSTIPGSTVIDSSARNLNMGSAPSRTSGSGMPASMNNVNSPNSQLQQQQRQQQHHQQQHLQQQQQQQQQQMIQLQKHQFANAAAAASRNKTPASSNGSVYSDHLPSSSSMAAKFPNALSAFPQNLVQSSNSSPTHSPQWKNTGRTTTSQVPPSLASQNTSSLKSLPQQQTRTQQTHTQISFGGNSKSLTAPQGQQQAPSNNQSPSSPMVGGSPTTSISKSAGGSPRTTTSASTGNKANQASALSSQQGKSSPSVTRKSSPVGGRNAPSILGNPHTSSSSGGKPQLPQQQQQQQHQHQLSKQAIQQVQAQQLFYSNAYMQAQAQAQAQNSSVTTGSATTGYYLQNQRRRLEHQHQQQQQQQQGSPAASSGGMLSMSNPATLTNSNTSDPAKVVAAAMKGGLPSQGILHSTQFSTSQSSGNPHQLMPAGFPYVHAVPAAVQVKPTEQKQPAGE